MAESDIGGGDGTQNAGSISFSNLRKIIDYIHIPDYYPAYESQMAIHVGLINACLNVAEQGVNGFAALLRDALGNIEIDDAPRIGVGNVVDPSILEPPVDIPSSANAADVMSLFDTKYLELVEMLKKAFVEFRETYFPGEPEAYLAAEDWLQEAIDNPRALPNEVVHALMADDEARVLKDASRASDAVLSTFAARGFPLPPGAAASAVLQIQQTAQDKLAESSRKIITASVEQARWTIEKLMGLREASMSEAIEYIKALASGPDMASRLVGIGYDAQSKLISAAAQFFGVRVNAQELITKNRQFNVSAALEAAKANQASELAIIDTRIKALLGQCQLLAQVSTSLLNNLNIGNQMSASTNASHSFSHN
jgi:hypothetical protein